MTDETFTGIDEIYASIIEKLEKEKAELLDALIELYDNQNDAPIERHRERWEAAMAKAKTAIENAEKTLPL